MIPKYGRRPEVNSDVLFMAYEMGAAATMSTPLTNWVKLCAVTPDFQDLQKIEPIDQPPEADTPASSDAPRELGGRNGPEPTRYGDWEHRGRCIDF
jgi:hypothetical protein